MPAPSFAEEVTPPGGFTFKRISVKDISPDNRITVEAALLHYTRDAAYASFEESRTGTITAGKYADFVVLSEDILTLPHARLLDARVQLTVLRGRETFRAAQQPVR